MILQITAYIFMIITATLIIHKQNNVVEKFLMNLLFLMIGTIMALGELYLAVNFPKGQRIYLKQPIIFSLLFISILLILMLYNMYYIWKEINSLKGTYIKWQRLMYNNRFLFFIISIILIVSIVVCAYGFIYFIINNLPSSIASDLSGNFMDDGRRKKFSECVYFSGVTFFTVGYGDMIPKGIFFCSIVLLEMITSYLLSIISIPILLSILIGKYRNISIIKYRK
ncbi:two pore domain potassium channel family protein [Clostridium bovifaecis]|uniref:Two pore domain potassium channel family protein n=1 Tax=Clostridium bovifaecis TaxID=2184719 RepID=A0A6I6ET74_9CLOT|nr:two pore domain potassium channel family protein [Clostridium bovifaecis]